MWQQPFALRHFNPVYVGLGSKAVKLRTSTSFPLYPQHRTFVGAVGMSAQCQ
jgi:hypothetical protein